jgi:hypothetical protein
MDEKPERPSAGEPDLAAALRRARIENAERAEAVAELREIELGRLALLESALQRVVRQTPPGVDLFDLTLARGDRPRVFLDMIAFIEMARDRRTYRFFQDTLYGRVLIAESPKVDTIVAACTNYVARRLVERERALAAEAFPAEEGGDDAKPPFLGRGRALPVGADEPAPGRNGACDDPEAPLHAPLGGLGGPEAVRSGSRMPGEVSSGPPPSRRPGFLARALGVLLMTVGALTLMSLLALVGRLIWTHRLGEVWTKAWTGWPF